MDPIIQTKLKHIHCVTPTILQNEQSYNYFRHY